MDCRQDFIVLAGAGGRLGLCLRFRLCHLFCFRLGLDLGHDDRLGLRFRLDRLDLRLRLDLGHDHRLGLRFRLDRLDLRLRLDLGDRFRFRLGLDFGDRLGFDFRLRLGWVDARHHHRRRRWRWGRRRCTLGRTRLRGHVLGIVSAQRTQQRQLGFCVRIAGIELQRLVVCLTCQFCMHVAQVLVGGGVARIGADRHVERGARLVILTAGGKQHGQVVVRFRQIRMVFGQLGEYRDGFGRLALLGQDHTLDETHLHVARILCQECVDLYHRFACLAGAHQLGDIGEFVGQREGARGQRPDARNGQQHLLNPAQRRNVFTETWR